MIKPEIVKSANPSNPIFENQNGIGISPANAIFYDLAR
jgi:hypothetical protein